MPQLPVDERIVLAQTITTKSPGGQPTSGEKWAVTTVGEQFEKIFKENKLVAKAQYGSDFYGVTKKAVKQEIDKDKMLV